MSALDRVHASAEALTDIELRLLIRSYERQVVEDGYSPGVRAWYAELARELRSVALWRVVDWTDLVDHITTTSRIPPTWAQAVEMLPPLPPGDASTDRGGGAAS